MWITISSCELYCAPENKLVGIPVLPLAPSCYPEPSEPSCGKRLAVDVYTLVRFGHFNLYVEKVGFHMPRSLAIDIDLLYTFWPVL